MDYGNGDQGTWLPITKDEKQIYFCRNENHVHAWHCNTLPLTDSRIIEIKELPCVESNKDGGKDETIY